MFLLLLAIPALASNPAGVAVVPALPEVLKKSNISDYDWRIGYFPLFDYHLSDD
jgi:hypothetical protein